MNQKVVLVSEAHKTRIMLMIEGLPLEPLHEIIIREHKKDRSAEQNAIYWKWLTVIANELGETKEALHEHYKDRFLVQIYERDNEEYAEMIQSLRDVWKSGMKKEAVDLRKKIVALTSTTTATVKQMTEYLHCIEMRSAELAIRLPFPEDYQR